MGHKFFVDWALWEKMTFVLACGIVLTIIGGLCKLAYSTWKIQNYAKVEASKAERSPEAVESQPAGRQVRGGKDDVPFGIRAIESGIEIDGVWISRGNTPIPSCDSSICNESRNPQTSATPSALSSQLELPQPVHGSSSRSSSTFDRAVSAERLPSDSRPSSPGPITTGARGRPDAQVRYSNPNLLRNSSTLNALEGFDSGASPALCDPSAYKSSSSCSRESDESDYMALSLPQLQEARPYEAVHLNPRAPPSRPVDPRTDLDLLQSHRLSHVAETGQLTPRIRKLGPNGEWASVAESSVPETRVSMPVDYFIPRRTTPSPPLSNVRSSYNETVPSAFGNPPPQGCYPSNEAKQAVPLLDTYQPRGPDAEDDEKPSPVIASPYNLRQSQVLRKVNSGFEILRPGTLVVPTTKLVDDRDIESGEKRRSRRLQKKRRPSSDYSTDYRTSNFVEHV
ncbi:hypothetical protein K432DRAFT_38560 [Lepidopterella palustris CBS 459.81]|uniref:Uncharacterized protein n=1 Tax=Lepidopterella palustris CBS 459.81 TaxID=1314670 RepID=A0A8E2JFF0_9PEZI|nr:hypothetical protein K432DRAFT_38560 [Lepidopterella palustris CBS 459.81]